MMTLERERERILLRETGKKQSSAVMWDTGREKLVNGKRTSASGHLVPDYWLNTNFVTVIIIINVDMGLRFFRFMGIMHHGDRELSIYLGKGQSKFQVQYSKLRSVCGQGRTVQIEHTDS